MILHRIKNRCCRISFQLFLLPRDRLLQCFIILVLFTLLVTLIFNYVLSIRSVSDSLFTSKQTPQLDVLCQSHNYVTKFHVNAKDNLYASWRNVNRESEQLLGNKGVLLFLENLNTTYAKSIQNFLQHARIPFITSRVSESLPNILNSRPSFVSVILFEHFSSYLKLDWKKRHKLDSIMHQYNIGMISFIQKIDSVKSDIKLSLAEGPYSYVGDFPMIAQFNSYIRDIFISNTSPVLKVTKKGRLLDLQVGPEQNWTTMTPMNDTLYDSIAFTKKERFLSSNRRQSENSVSDILHNVERKSVTSDSKSVMKSLVLHDLGKIDQIERILFGGPPEFWLNKLLLLDSIHYLSRGSIKLPLQRFIQIDVDDIFVGKPGIRLKVEDIDAMLAAQERWSQHFIPNFRFNLGFSGKYFMRKASEEEMRGDQYLLSKKDEFQWFCHSWNHIKAHKYSSLAELKHMLNMNKAFAQKHGIRVDSGYSVAPHHSGVFPVHLILYQAWKEVWNISVTSTKEYPHHRPSRLRRGFIYHGMKVLPRQECGIYTDTIILDDYPGGPQRLITSVLGGELFEVLLFNIVSPVMTHMSNYCCDRLGLYIFDALFRFVSCWTNLQLVTEAPISLANRYFSLYPDEKEPVWVDHCQDKRHQQILPKEYTCKLPYFIIVGPQKTGTTALSKFLSVHPQLVINRLSKRHFEEIQFFSSQKEYELGQIWYSDQFPDSRPTILINSTTHSVHHFEKSATYFDNKKSPARIKALIPKVKLVFVFIDPALRAYSWYQHQKSWNNSAAVKYSFHDIITASPNSSYEILRLKSRCLNPGNYMTVLNKWLHHFPIKQMHFVDGLLLKNEPPNALLQIQRFLNLTNVVDYRSVLKLNTKKRFYCFDPAFLKQFNAHSVNARISRPCLGSSKGRKYPQLPEKDYQLLYDYYYPQNLALYKFFKSKSIHIPDWLSDVING